VTMGIALIAIGIFPGLSKKSRFNEYIRSDKPSFMIM